MNVFVSMHLFIAKCNHSIAKYCSQLSNARAWVNPSIALQWQIDEHFFYFVSELKGVLRFISLFGFPTGKSVNVFLFFFWFSLNTFEIQVYVYTIAMEFVGLSQMISSKSPNILIDVSTMCWACLCEILHLFLLHWYCATAEAERQKKNPNHISNNSMISILVMI